MNNLCKVKKILTFVICGVLTLNLMFFSSSNNNNNTNNVQAQTIAELQAAREANEAKIAEYQQALKDIESEKQDQQVYQNTLSEQIDVMEENLSIVNEELNRIVDDINTAEQNIVKLTDTIADNEIEIANNKELFKERLRAMYVTGNDTIASAVIGSTDFYDMLSRVEMVSRIAEHDNELIQTLKTQLEDLEVQKSALETEKLTCEMKKAEQEVKRDELMDKRQEYNEAYEKTQEYLDSLALQESSNNKSIEDLEADNKDLEAAEEEIKEIIRQEQERLEQEKLEQERLEQERLEAEKEEAAQATTPPSSNNSSNDSSNDSSSDSSDDYEEPSSSSSSFLWPTNGGFYVSSDYGYRWGSLHAGIDIAGGSIRGSSALASRSGTVIGVSNSCTHDYGKSSNCCGNGYGNYVIISHGDSFSTMYAHLTTAYVSVGDYVSAGTAIGSIGCTGFSTGNHLHFEIRENGTAVNPHNYLSY